MTAIAHQPYPVTRVITGVRDQLSDVAGLAVWAMDSSETTFAIAQVQAAEAQLAEAKARLLSQAKRIDIAGNTAASSTANWHAHQTHTTRRAAHRGVRLAEGLEHCDLVRVALARGRLHVEQAEVILRGLAELPDQLDPELIEKAEAHLVEQARHFDAKALKIPSRRILEVIDPDAADAHEAKLLEEEEQRAQAATRLVMYDDGHGKVHGRFTLPAFEAAALKKALLAIAAPRHQASKGRLGERLPTPKRLGLALCQYVARYPPRDFRELAASTPPSS